MMQKVDHKIALEILKEAVEAVLSKLDRYKPSSNNKVEIESVISGTHLTFRYILLTGLLAKVCNKNINPLSLQAGAPFEGAYDARSLCHKVIVPNESELFQKRLGGSNEPFLNKPARFTHLSSKNAVRKGDDLKALNNVIKVFENILKSKDAAESLNDCIFYILKRPIRTVSNESAVVLNNEDHSAKIKVLIDKFLSKSLEGETSTVVVGALLKALYSIQPNTQILVHPSNQAGSSSREICDIDILINKANAYGVEVKDKSYSEHDVLHAIQKVQDNNLNKMLFIEGHQGKGPKCSIPEGFNFHLLKIDDFAANTLAVLIPISVDAFTNLLKATCIEMRAKDKTYDWLESCI